MTVSQYLRRQYDIGLAILDEEMSKLGIPKRGDQNVLIPKDALVLNSVMLLQSTMNIVLFEKNRVFMSPFYDCDIGGHDVLEPLTEFDDVPVKSIKVMCFGTPTTTPTLTTDYGDILLTLSAEAVATLYAQIGATVDLRPSKAVESDTSGDNIIRADFGKKR